MSALLLVAAAVGGCNRGDPYTVAQHVERARTMLAKKQPATAAIELKTALQADGRNVDARLLLADAFIAMSQGQNAEAELVRATQYGASSEVTQAPLARAHLVQGQFDRVLKEVPVNNIGDPERVAELDEIRGDALLATGAAKDALASYNNALAINPRALGALFGKARVLAQQGRRDLASEAVESALAIDANNLTALMLKGDLAMAADNLEGALAAYGAAVQADPASGSAQLALGSAEITAKRYDQAETRIAAVRKVYPTLPQLNYIDALLQYSRQDYKAADAAIQRALSILPDNPPALLLSAAISYQLGALSQAAVNAQRVLNVYPGNAFARKLLASASLKRGEPTKAFQLLDPLIANGNKDPEVLALAGNALVQAGKMDRAIDYFTKAAEARPGDASLQRALGLANLADGRVDRAIASFETVTKLDNGSSTADTYLVIGYLAKKDYAHALGLAQAAVAKDPKDANAYNLRAGVFLAQGDTVDARADYEKALSLQPGLIAAATNLARIEVREQHPDVAKKRLTDVLEKNPKSLEVMLSLYDLASAQGQTDDAVRWLDAAIRDNPTAAAPKVLKLRDLEGKGDMAAALPLAQATTADGQGGTEALALLAQAQAGTGDRSGAVSNYGKLAAAFPNDARYALRIAELEAADNHLASANAWLRKATAIAPNFIEAKAALGTVLIRQNDIAGAQAIATSLQKSPTSATVGTLLAADVAIAGQKYDAATKALESIPPEARTAPIVAKLFTVMALSDRRAAGEKMLAQWMNDHPKDAASRIFAAAAFQSLGDQRRAQALYQEALALDPNDVVALNELAVMLQDSDPKQAGEYAARAYQRSPGNDAIADTYGWILVRQGDKQRAKEVLEKAVAVNPNNAEARYHFGVALNDTGSKQSARTQLEAALKLSDRFPHADDARKLLQSL